MEHDHLVQNQENEFPGHLGKREVIFDTEEDSLDHLPQKLKEGQEIRRECRVVGKEHQENFSIITHQLIIKVELGKIMTGKVQDFSILERNQDQKKEVYSIILENEGQKQICFLESRNKEQHHTKIMAYKTGSFHLSDLMPIEDSKDHKALMFVQTPKEKPAEGPLKSELVLFLRDKKLYKVFIKVLSEVDSYATLFRISNARNSMGVLVQKTKIYLLYGLKDREFHEKVSSQVISIVPSHPQFRSTAVVDLAVQESVYGIDQLDSDLIYAAMLFENGKIGLITASKSRKQQVGELIGVNTLASEGGSNQLKVVRMFFKPLYNSLIVISKSNEGDYNIEIFSLTFDKSEKCPIQVKSHENTFMIRRSLLIDDEEDTNIHFAITETFVNMSLEVLAIPENMKKFTAFKFKYNKEAQKHEEIRYGQLENQNVLRRETLEARVTLAAQQLATRNRTRQNINDPDRTDNEEEEQQQLANLNRRLFPFVQENPNPVTTNPLRDEFGEESNTPRTRIQDEATVVAQLPAFRPPLSSTLEDCVQFDPIRNLTANCNAFVNKSKQIVFIFKK